MECFRLEAAYTYDSPDFKGSGGYSGQQSAAVIVNPIIAQGKNLICTPLHPVVALEPESDEAL